MRAKLFSKLTFVLVINLVIVYSSQFFAMSIEHTDKVKEELFKEAREALKKAKAKEVPLLSPSNFSKANEFYKKSLEYYEKGDRLGKIRKNLKLTVEHVEAAFKVAKLSRNVLESLMKMKKEAEVLEIVVFNNYFCGKLLTAKDFEEEQSYFRSKVGRMLRKAAIKIEDGDMKSGSSITKDAEKEYRRRVIDLLKKVVLADAKQKLKDAEETITKESFRKAKHRLDVIENFIGAQKEKEFAIGKFFIEVQDRVIQDLILAGVDVGIDRSQMFSKSTFKLIGVEGKKKPSTKAKIQAPGSIKKSRLYDSGVDFDKVLIESFASIADMLSDYQDRVANESYLDTARTGRGLTQEAQLMDYEVTPEASASAWLSLIFNNNTSGIVAVKKGDQFSTDPDKTGKSIVFEYVDEEPITIDLGTLIHDSAENITGKKGFKKFVGIPVQAGKTILSEVLGTSDGTPNQSFRLSQVKVIDTSLEIKVKTKNEILDWKLCKSLICSSHVDKHYVAHTDENGSTTILFGDGQNGAILPPGANIVASSYRVGSGKEGNVGSKTITIIKRAPALQNFQAGVVNPEAATGGKDRETIELAISFAPKKKISHLILNYLRKNPDAGDTLEGITKWWLEFEMLEQTVDEVAEALESLIQQGLIERYKKKDGPTFYKIIKEEEHKRLK